MITWSHRPKHKPPPSSVPKLNSWWKRTVKVEEGWRAEETWWAATGHWRVLIFHLKRFIGADAKWRGLGNVNMGSGWWGPPLRACVPPRHVYSGSALSLLKQVATRWAVGCRRGCGGGDIMTEQGERSERDREKDMSLQTDSTTCRQTGRRRAQTRSSGLFPSTLFCVHNTSCITVLWGVEGDK